MKLSVIVPAYNEQATIGKMLASLIKISQVKEIVVVDDHSQDKTVSEVKKLKDLRIKLFCHKVNLGKGAAIRTGLKYVSGDYVLIQDADLEYDPADIPKLLEPIKSGKAEVVYGSRFIGARTNMFFWHFVGNTFLNFVINILFNSIMTDMETCYKVLPTNLFRDLKIRENDFRIEPEITCKLLKRKTRIIELPIIFMARTYEEGKKITWRDGFKALDTILKIRLSNKL